MKNGPYELVVAPDDYPGKRYRGRYIYEHHLVYWRHTDIVVPPGFVIHHLNEQKRDNRIENLELKAAIEHTREHAEERKVPLKQLMCACGDIFEMAERNYRYRTKKNKSSVFSCSRSCAARTQMTGVTMKSTINHGDRSMYTGRGCRCMLCREAQRIYNKNLRSRHS